jgi:hypothetical protein
VTALSFIPIKIRKIEVSKGEVALEAGGRKLGVRLASGRQRMIE